jgi:transcriptional regulator with XRE-family HTH domain
MNVGQAIRWFRQHRGISQGDVARRAACSVSYLSLLENNKRDPTLSTVAKIADALHVPVGTLFLVAAEPSDLGCIDERLVDELRRAVVSSAPTDRSGVAHG